jgi:hypothetical protein
MITETIISVPVVASASAASTTAISKHTIINACDWLKTEPPPVDPVLVNILDVGDKMAIIGASKTRKSFFTLQMAVCLAAGMDFLAWKVAKPRRVLVVQMEIQDRHYWRRMRGMCNKMRVDEQTLGDRLSIINARGALLKPQEIYECAQRVKAEVIIIDPLYKLLQGDENSAQDMKPVLEMFDKITRHTGAALIYIHHDAKGSPGDRDTRDRGSGSSVIGRDYDACITLTEHQDKKEDARVIQTLLRNYPPQEPFAARWQDMRFQRDDTLPAIPVTSRSKAASNQRGPGVKEIAQQVKDEILTKPWQMVELKPEIQTRYKVGRTKAEDVCKLLSGMDGVETAKTNTFPVKMLIGPPKVTERAAKRMTDEWHTRKLDSITSATSNTN